MDTITSEVEALLEQIENVYAPDAGGIDLIGDVLEYKPVDHLPLIFWRSQNTSSPGSSFSLHEQFYSKEKMLHGLLEDVLICASSGFSSPLCIRPNFGTVFIPAMTGLEYTVPDDAYPWMTGHADKKAAGKLRISDALQSEMMQRALEYLDYFCKTVPKYIHVYLPDTQGPFDLAHLICGDSLFYDLYDDPGFVHSVMEFSTELYCEVTRTLKRQIGEPMDECFHGHALVRGIYMRNGGVRISEDTPTLLSPEHIDTFVLPYVRQALNAFGGGFIHYCGKNDYLLDAFLSIENLRALNFGNPEMHDTGAVMKKCLEQQVCYFGKWPAEDGETSDDYLRRMHQVSRGGTEGLLLHVDEDMFPEKSPLEIYAAWKHFREDQS